MLFLLQLAPVSPKRHVACAHQTRHRLRQQHCPVNTVLLDADVNSGLQVGGVQVE